MAVRSVVPWNVTQSTYPVRQFSEAGGMGGHSLITPSRLSLLLLYRVSFTASQKAVMLPLRLIISLTR